MVRPAKPSRAKRARAASRRWRRRSASRRYGRGPAIVVAMLASQELHVVCTSCPGPSTPAASLGQTAAGPVLVTGEHVEEQVEHSGASIGPDDLAAAAHRRRQALLAGV